MKFQVYWAEVLSQNAILKGCLLFMGVVSLVLTVGLVSLASKDPVVFERACFTKQMPLTDSRATVSEIEAFSRVAIGKRFDTEATDTGVFLADDEVATRKKELDELSKKGMTQKIIVNSVQVDKSTVTVDADRVLSIGKVKTVLPLPVRLRIETKNRSTANPYGLVLSDTSAIKSEGERK